MKFETGNLKFGLPLIIAFAFFGCSKKDPEIFIKAGDMGGNSVHYVSSEINFNSFSYSLDIDGDHFNDFNFAYGIQQSSFSGYISYSVNPINIGQSSYICVDEKGDPTLLKKGDKIDESLNWNKSQTQYLYFYSSSTYPNYSTYSTGNWVNVKDGYLGFKIIRGDKTCYGWMRLNVDSYYPNSFYLTDYGYIEY